MAYSLEVRDRAENLYVVEGMSYARIARLTGVTARQIATWGQEDNWQEGRREYRRACSEIKRGVILLRSRLVAGALETMDPKMISAVARLESAVRDRGEVAEFPAGTPDDGEEEARFSSAAEVVSIVQEVLKRKMDDIFAQPERLTPGIIKEFKTALELIEQLRKKYRMEEEKPKGLSDETVLEIRQKILGCKE